MGTRYATTLYLALWNLTCLGLFALAWGYGLVQQIFSADASHITTIQAGLLALALAYATFQTWKLDRMRADAADHHTTVQTLEESLSLPYFLAEDIFIYLGICGTLIGFIIFAQNIGSDASPEAIAALLVTMKASMGTAFNPSLCGIAASRWVKVIVYIQEWRTRDIHTESLTARAAL